MPSEFSTASRAERWARHVNAFLSDSHAGATVVRASRRAPADPAFMTRVNDAALRILKQKQAFGLLPC